MNPNFEFSCSHASSDAHLTRLISLSEPTLWKRLVGYYFPYINFHFDCASCLRCWMYIEDISSVVKILVKRTFLFYASIYFCLSFRSLLAAVTYYIFSAYVSWSWTRNI